MRVERRWFPARRDIQRMNTRLKSNLMDFAIGSRIQLFEVPYMRIVPTHPGECVGKRNGVLIIEAHGLLALCQWSGSHRRRKCPKQVMLSMAQSSSQRAIGWTLAGGSSESGISGTGQLAGCGMAGQPAEVIFPLFFAALFNLPPRRVPPFHHRRSLNTDPASQHLNGSLTNLLFLILVPKTNLVHSFGPIRCAQHKNQTRPTCERSVVSRNHRRSGRRNPNRRYTRICSGPNSL